MKKMFMMLCALALPACVLFTACDNKDDDAPSTPLAKTVEGTYPVEIGVVLNVGGEDTEETTSDASVVVTAATDNTVNLALNGFNFIDQDIPISLTDIAVSGSEGNATLAYSGAITSEKLVQMGLKNLTGTLNGTIKDGVMDVQLNIELRSEPEDPEPSMIIKVSINSK